MSTRVLQPGPNGGDFTVQWSDDSYGGAKTTALKVAAADGSATIGLAGQLAINGSTGKLTVGVAGTTVALPGNLFNVYWDKSANDGSAGAATAEHVFFRAPQALQVMAVRYVPDNALTA